MSQMFKIINTLLHKGKVCKNEFTAIDRTSVRITVFLIRK